MPTYSLSPPQHLQNSQWQDIYGDFMENGINMDPYRPGYGEPEVPPMPGEDEGR